ncbi:MAG TPA: IS4 family transposase [Nostocaceae cyanobacterium]|nr:IS4 family transposase [Nostocaceae cyanobacterium]
MTTAEIELREVVLSIGDTTFLDYDDIKVKRFGYGPIGKGGNGLILHSALAVNPENGQPIGLLWQKLWNREHKPKPSLDETPAQKKQRQKEARKIAAHRPFCEKESYRWVEAMTTVEKQVSTSTHVIHVFDREGDITEVFDYVRQHQHCGVLVRATHNRSLDQHSERLWQKLESQPIQFQKQINLPATTSHKAREATVAVRFCQVSLRTPYRFDNRHPIKVYAVYTTEINPPDGVPPLEWMLLTTEVVTNIEQAARILRWYCYRWHVEEYHKILKSGCQVERYRLAGESMKVLCGFLTVLAVELLQLTYLHRTQPDLPALVVLNPTQEAVLKAHSSNKSSKSTVFNVAWAVEAIARLGGYLEHRRNTPIGVQVLWRGWLKLHDLCQGWKLAIDTYREK